ncbi:MAG: cyclic nucleotide-binding domain-containing protein [Bdellovibrionota bacterium]
MAQPPVPRRLKKGELLFNEGDPSKSMYFIQSGTIRLFKKKGNASVELGLIHKGEVIGEMGFLDGGPRSASAEAIHETTLNEITNANLVEHLKVLPPWLMVLLKTIVNRLRSANNKIRQLESVSTAYTYGSEGVSTTYQYLSIYDILKVCTAVLVVGARNGEPGEGGAIKIAMSRVNRYANQIMGIHVSKITEMLDILERVGLAKVDRAVLDKIEVHLTDLNQIELLIAFINDENLKDHTKKTNFSVKAVLLMGYIVKYMNQFPPDKDGNAVVNLAVIIEAEKAANGGKEPFRIDDTITELVKAKLSGDVSFKDSTSITLKVRARELTRMYQIQKVLKEVETINDQKREQAARNNTGTKR